MLHSIKNAVSELEHVVWPTDKESKKYMVITVGTILCMGLFLAIMGYILQTSLSAVRAQFPHDSISTQTVSGEDMVTEADLEALKKAAEAKKATGITIDPLSLSGAQ